MTHTTRFRFSASAIERLSCPDGTKAVEVSDADGVTGLRLAVTRSSKTFWFRFVLAGTKGAIRLGTFPALSVVEDVVAQAGVAVVGRVPTIRIPYFAITSDRSAAHPLLAPFLARARARLGSG